MLLKKKKKKHLPYIKVIFNASQIIMLFFKKTPRLTLQLAASAPTNQNIPIVINNHLWKTHSDVKVLKTAFAQSSMKCLRLKLF